MKVRYKQTFLGVAWAVLQPAMMMMVFTVFFHKLAGIDTGGLPAPLFYLSGLLPWFFFQQAVASSGITLRQSVSQAQSRKGRQLGCD